MLTETVGPQKKYLIECPIPTQAEIKKRMAKRFGGARHLVDELINPCAEEAERIILSFISGHGMAAPVLIRSQRYASRGMTNGQRKKYGYTCPNCQSTDIKLTDKYCSGCGKQLQWL